MLTRAGVARRLRKSIATVRRMEGISLHPEVDANGVHWFRRQEVEALLGKTGEQKKTRFCTAAISTSSSDQASTEGPPCDVGATTSNAMAESVELVRARAWADHALALVLSNLAERERLSAAAAAEEQSARELLAQARSALIDELESCSPRELRRLGPSVLADLLEWLEDNASAEHKSEQP